MQTHVTAIAQPLGVDLQIDFTNPTTAAISLDTGGDGVLELSGLEVGRLLTFYDIRQGTEPRAVDREEHGPTDASAWSGSIFTWPGDLYSPVMLLENSRYHIGVSLLYNVLDYEHDVGLQLRSFFGESQWSVNMLLKTTLPAGATRRYTVAVRFAPTDHHLMDVLIAYRNFFHANYGGVQYRRDPRPIFMASTAQGHMISQDNPYGFIETATRRPDVFGWRPWAQYFRDSVARGYGRGMLWAPTGLNPGGPNYHSLFMSPMEHIPAMAASLGELHSIPDSGLQMGYYWGLANTVMWGEYPSWTPLNAVDFDLNNPDHVRRALDEFDRAVDLNASLIGMDAVVGIPGWQLHRWLSFLHERAPNVRFGCELTPSDITHTQCASLVFSHYVTRSDMLADFILPGHETWSIIRYDLLREPHHAWTQAERQQVMADVADMGYAPLPTWDTTLDDPPRYNAAPTWLQTIPPELRPCSEPPQR